MYLEEIRDFSILFIKCLVILVFFGIILPEIIDYLLFYLFNSYNVHNSIFVNNSVIAYSVRRYIYIFKNYVTY